MQRTVLLFALVSSAVGRLPADTILVSGPIEGYTFDAPTASFRPVIGLPGSASFRDAILTGYSRGSVAPQKDYGIGLQNGQWSLITGLSSDSPAATAISDIQAGAEQIVWSADASSALFISRSAKWIQALNGLPGLGLVSAPVDLSLLGGSLSAIAVDAAGKRIAIGVSGDSGGVYLITDGGAPVPLWNSSNPVALAFSADGTELYALDSASLQGTVFQLSNFTTRSFALDGLKDPVAIQSTRDAANRKLLLVAGGNDYVLRVYDAASLDPLNDIALDSRPSELTAFGRNSLLLGRRARPNDPLWLFTTTPAPSVFFVPAISAAGGQQ